LAGLVVPGIFDKVLGGPWSPGTQALSIAH
jgi:hypothetical protein